MEDSHYRKLNRKGFTIVELVIVMAAVAIVGVSTVPIFGAVTKQNREKHALAIAQDAAQKYTTATAKDGYGDCDVVIQVYDDMLYYFNDGEVIPKDDEYDYYTTLDEVTTSASYQKYLAGRALVDWSDNMEDAAINEVDKFYVIVASLEEAVVVPTPTPVITLAPGATASPEPTATPEPDMSEEEEAQKAAKDLYELNPSNYSNCVILMKSGMAYGFHCGEPLYVISEDEQQDYYDQLMGGGTSGKHHRFSYLSWFFSHGWGYYSNKYNNNNNNNKFGFNYGSNGQKDYDIYGEYETVKNWYWFEGDVSTTAWIDQTAWFQYKYKNTNIVAGCTKSNTWYDRADKAYAEYVVYKTQQAAESDFSKFDEENFAVSFTMKVQTKADMDSSYRTFLYVDGEISPRFEYSAAAETGNVNVNNYKNDKNNSLWGSFFGYYSTTQSSTYKTYVAYLNAKEPISYLKTVYEKQVYNINDTGFKPSQSIQNYLETSNNSYATYYVSYDYFHEQEEEQDVPSSNNNGWHKWWIQKDRPDSWEWGEDLTNWYFYEEQWWYRKDTTDDSGSDPGGLNYGQLKKTESSSDSDTDTDTSSDTSTDTTTDTSTDTSTDTTTDTTTDTSTDTSTDTTTDTSTDTSTDTTTDSSSGNNGNGNGNGNGNNGKAKGKNK